MNAYIFITFVFMWIMNIMNVYLFIFHPNHLVPWGAMYLQRHQTQLHCCSESENFYLLYISFYFLFEIYNGASYGAMSTNDYIWFNFSL